MTSQNPSIIARVGFRDLGGGTFRIRVEPNFRPGDPLYMAGTEGTGRYVVVATGNPVDSSVLSAQLPGWTAGYGGSEYRFSTVTCGGQQAAIVKLGLALNAAFASNPTGTTINPDAPAWAKSLVPVVTTLPTEKTIVAPPATPAPDDKAQLLAQARELGIKGANSRWTVVTPRAKVAAATPAEPTPPAETEADERVRLIADLRARKVRGACFATRWSTETLRAKAANASQS